MQEAKSTTCGWTYIDFSQHINAGSCRLSEIFTQPITKKNKYIMVVLQFHWSTKNPQAIVIRKMCIWNIQGSGERHINTTNQTLRCHEPFTNSPGLSQYHYQMAFIPSLINGNLLESSRGLRHTSMLMSQRSNASTMLTKMHIIIHFATLGSVELLEAKPLGWGIIQMRAHPRGGSPVKYWIGNEYRLGRS